MEFFVGVISLFVGLLGMGAAQGLFAVGIMYFMHKKMPQYLSEKRYGAFDFDSFNKLSLQNFIVRIAIIFIGPTLILHLLEYIVVYKEIVRHWGVVLSLLFVFEVAAIGVGLFKVFHLDMLRLVILTACSAVIYLFLQQMLVWNHLLI